MERDWIFWQWNVYPQNFNSHAHVERDDARPTIWQLTRNFNSHAHVERDRVINSSNSIYLISTHTLTWSVTCNSRICITYHAFQLTRSRGAWPTIYKNSCKGFKFQLTRSRGAWPTIYKNSCKGFKFQLTRSRGAWPGITKTQNHHYIFQLTRSRGAWHNQYHTASYLCHFNSHAHVERDSQLSVKMSGAVISTHTLTWSVTEMNIIH